MKAALVVLALWAPAVAAAAEDEGPRLLATQSVGVVPIDDERIVVVDGLVGDLTIRAGHAREVRFRSSKAGGRGDAPLAVWLDGTTLKIAAPEGAAAEPRVLDLAIGGDLAVTIRATGSTVRLAGLTGTVLVTGHTLNVEARGLKRSVSLEIDRSTAVLESLEADVRLRGQALAATVSAVTGDLDAELTGGKLDVRSVRALTVVGTRTPMTILGVSGAVNLRAGGETLSLSQAKKGGELTLSGTPAMLSGLEGDFNVSTDSELAFQDCRASLHVDSYGGAVKGSKNEGLLEVRTRDAEVTVSAIFGPTRIQGDGLRLLLGEITGDLFIDTSGSKITVARPAATVEIVGERNSVGVIGSTERLKVTNRGGSVRITQAKGPVDVQADDEVVVVSWASLNTKDESTIKNDTGEVKLRMPPGTPCRLEAKSERGRVTSEINRVTVSADGSSAEGPLPTGGKPLITVVAHGDVSVLSSEPTDPQPDAEPDDPDDGEQEP